MSPTTKDLLKDGDYALVNEQKINLAIQIDAEGKG
jgi:hypothetical protein